MAEESTQGRRKGKQAEREMEPRSDVWPYFARFRDDEDGNKKARCKRCQKVLLAIHGTRSLWKHVNKCWGQEPAPVAAAAAALTWPEPRAPSRPAGSSDREPVLELEEASKHLARMIALRGHDPSVLEDDCFRSFVASLNPEFEMPSRVAIEEMCDGIFDEARRDSISQLRRAPGRLCFAVGKAKTIEAGEVMCIACHFVDDQWKLHKVVMDALLPSGDPYFEYGPILGVDEVNDDAAEYVIHVISQHEDRLSLVAYETTDDDIHTGLKEYIEEINSDRNLRCSATTYVDNVLHSIARCLVPDSLFSGRVFQAGETFPDEIQRNFQDIVHLDLTRQERLQLLSELGLDYGWAYDQHWCARYYSLEILRKRGFTKLAAGSKLCVELLCKVWGQVYRGIQRISDPTGATSNLCLAELLKLREILQPELAGFSGDGADVQNGIVRFYYGEAVHALRHASDTLDKAIRDSYLVWSVPLALDPRYKLSYIEFSFQRAFGSEAGKHYISKVTRKINELYAGYIKEYGSTIAADHSRNASEMVATTSADPLFEQAWNEHRRWQDVMANNCYLATQTTELDRYLQDRLAPATEDFDLLNWWKVHSSEYPMVARMARDALAMPTCSKPSSDQIAQVRSIVRRYSKKQYKDKRAWRWSS